MPAEKAESDCTGRHRGVVCGFVGREGMSPHTRGGMGGAHAAYYQTPTYTTPSINQKTHLELVHDEGEVRQDVVEGRVGLRDDAQLHFPREVQGGHHQAGDDL